MLDALLYGGLRLPGRWEEILFYFQFRRFRTVTEDGPVTDSASASGPAGGRTCFCNGSKAEHKKKKISPPGVRVSINDSDTRQNFALQF